MTEPRSPGQEPREARDLRELLDDFAVPSEWRMRDVRMLIVAAEERGRAEARQQDTLNVERLREENVQFRKMLALRLSGFTGARHEIPWYEHCGISHGADRPDCIVCRALAAEPQP